MRVVRRIAITILAAALLVVGLFVLNGAVLASRQRAESGVTSHASAPLPERGSKVRILTYNIAKAFLHEGGLSFESAEVVRARLARIASIIAAERPDMVFLQEAVVECALCPVDQVAEIAQGTGMHFWAFGENYNVGLPLLRIVGGNAILSRWPMQAAGNPDLPGRKPFWVSKNNRRILWCTMQVSGEPVLVGNVHADSFSLAGGARHFESIMAFLDRRPAVLAGDFNAEPHDESLRIVKASERFSGEIDGGAPTYPAPRPTRRIDFVLAPRSWEHLGTRVLVSDASDHAAVVADFRVP